MGLSVSIFLAAVGAVLAWAVNSSIQGVDLHAVGYILLVVGIIGAVLSMIFWSSWGGFHRQPYPGYPGNYPPGTLPPTP